MLCIIRGFFKSLIPNQGRNISFLLILKHLVGSRRQVYLDHNASTLVSKNVRQYMNNILKKYYGNPSSFYKIARKSLEIIEDARQQVANAMNADSCEIFFTGCATESNNAVLKSLSSYFFPKKKKIISTPIEHPSIIKTLEFLKTQGIIVEYCPVDNQGRVILTELQNLIDNNTFLICCMLANNEIGTVQDIKAVTKIAKRHNVLVLSDCVQAFGKIPINVKQLQIDYASFSAHKLYGPKGVGALYIKKGSPFIPFIHGGHQEKGLRAGTESLHNIAGFGATCKNIPKILKQMGHILDLKCQFIKKLEQIKPDCIINSPEKNCLPNTINITFPNVINTELMAMLDYYGISVSAGSACSSQEEIPSHVLKAIGLSDRAASETIRISLGSENLLADVNYCIKIFQNFFNGKITFIKMLSPMQLNKAFLINKDTFILDVRTEHSRKKIKSLPNSNEVPVMAYEKYIHHIPKDKKILVVCHNGSLSFIVAYYLKSQGFKNVSSLQSGIVGWKTKQIELYNKYSGQNVNILKN